MAVIVHKVVSVDAMKVEDWEKLEKYLNDGWGIYWSEQVGDHTIYFVMARDSN